jgi:hypothetical protein
MAAAAAHSEYASGPAANDARSWREQRLAKAKQRVELNVVDEKQHAFTSLRCAKEWMRHNTRCRYLLILGPWATLLFILRLACFVAIFSVSRVFTWGIGTGAVTSADSVEMQTYLAEMLIHDEFDANHNTFLDIQTPTEWWAYMSSIIAPSLPVASDRFFDNRNYLVDLTVRVLRTKVRDSVWRACAT